MGNSNQKTCVSENSISGGVCFISNYKVLKKLPPLHLQLHIDALNQKSAPTFLFALSNPLQNCLTRPNSTKIHRTARFQSNSLGADQGLPYTDWAVVLSNQKLLGTNEPLMIHKLIDILISTDSHKYLSFKI